jgi:hypothetical protein
MSLTLARTRRRPPSSTGESNDLDPKPGPVGGFVQPLEPLRTLLEGLLDPFAGLLGRVGTDVRSDLRDGVAEPLVPRVSHHLAKAVVHVEEGARFGVVDAQPDRGLLPGLVVDRVALVAADLFRDAVGQVHAVLAERGLGNVVVDANVEGPTGNVLAAFPR